MRREVLFPIRIDVDISATVQWCPFRLLLEQPHGHDVLRKVSDVLIQSHQYTNVLLIGSKAMVYARR